MPTCFALFCEHDSQDECKMLKFPSNEALRKQWISNTRKKPAHWKSGSRICTCHFAEGKKQAGPTIFAWTSYISKLRRNLDNREIIKDTSIPIVKEEIVVDTPRQPEVKEKPPVVKLPRGRTLKEKQPKPPKVKLPKVKPPKEKLPDVKPIKEKPSKEKQPKEKPLKEKQLKEEPQKEKLHKEKPPKVKPPKEKKPIEKPVRKGTRKRKYSSRLFTEPKITPEITQAEDDVNRNPKVVKLRVENLILSHEIGELEKQLREIQDNDSYSYERLTVEKLLGNDALIYVYTGLPNMQVFKYIANKMIDFQFKYDKWSVITLHMEEQLLMSLMKLRCNFGFSDIAYRFRVSASTVKNIVWTFVDGLHTTFFENRIRTHTFSSYADNQSEVPLELLPFPDCKILLGRIVIECESYQTGSGPNEKQKALKGIIGLSPSCEVIYASELHPESESYDDILLKSNISEKLFAGDMVICEEDLDLSSSTFPEGVEVLNPVLDKESGEQLQFLADVLNATSHVSMIIKNLRKFTVLDKILYPYRNNAYKIFQLCAALLNFQNIEVKIA